mgnify:CR=1 FL=1
MDNMVSIGKLCKQLALVFVTPYKHSSIESIKEDEDIKNPYEKNAKCVILALGIIFINLLMLKIDIIFMSSKYIKQKYDDYKNDSTIDRVESDYMDDIKSIVNSSQFVSSYLNNESKNEDEDKSDESEESSDKDERGETDYDKEDESE